MENQEALSRRNIHSGRKICEPSVPTWPKITDEVDNNIKEHIKRIFQMNKACLRKGQKQEDRKDVISGQLAESEIKERKAFRSMFTIGFNAVIKKLEKGQLRLVIMNRACHPAILKKAILSLALQQGCPAIAVSDLLSPICTSWTAVKSVTCLGITKTNGKNDFDALVTYIREECLIPSETNRYLCDKERISPEKRKANVEEEQRRQKEEKSKPKLTRPVVDFSKFYKTLQAKGHEKKFEGQSFISFSDEVCDEVIVFRRGIKITEELNRDNESYGIKPIVADVMGKVSTGGVKRKFEGTDRKSNYKSITIQQLNLNVNKKRKEKKKKSKRR